MKRAELVTRLKKDGRWTIHSNTPRGVFIFREYGGRAVTVKLLLRKGGKWEIEFPTYLFSSGISHFRAAVEEHRFCQNKQFLFSFVRMMQKIGAWKDIVNKGFIVVNEANARANKMDRKSILKDILL